MLLFAISGFLNGFSALFFGTFIYLRNKKDKIYLLFYLSNLSVALWAIPYGIWQLQTDRESAIFWCQILCMGTSLFPVLCLHLIIALIEKEREEKWILFFGYFQTIIYLIFAFTPHIVAGVRPVGGFLWWPIPGFLYFCFMVFCYFGLLGYASYLLFKNYKESKGIKKEQIKYTAVALMLPVLGAATNFPNWWNIEFIPFGNLFSFLYPFIMGYIISRYVYFDLKYIIGKAIVNIFSFLFIVLIVSMLIIINNFLQLINEKIYYLLVLLIGILIYNLVFKFFENLSQNIFYKQISLYQKNITDLEKNLVSILNLKELSETISNVLLKIIDINKIAIIFKDEEMDNYKISKIFGFSELGINSIINQFLSKFIETHKRPILGDQLIYMKENDGNNFLTEKLKEEILKNDIGLLLPIFKKEQLNGFIILGKKRSNDSYTKQDVDLLDALSNQISIAIENARLYKKVEDLSGNLQQKVDLQTKELRDLYEKEKRSREELEKLDQIKNQFLLAVQHHLKTPLTSMKWRSEFLLNQKQSKKNRESIENFKKSTESLIKVVNEFLDITQFQMGKKVLMAKSEINLKDVFVEIIDDLKLELKEKNIDIKLILKNKKDEFVIISNKEKIKMAFFNIVDNAIKYTKKGSIIIYLDKESNKILIKIKDSGMGISEETKKFLFLRPFERGKDALNIFATGRGIGLYISSQIILAHNGKIWVESEGEGKGSTFYIELPV